MTGTAEQAAGLLLRVGTRGSTLARTQTDWVVGRLRDRWPGLEVEVHVIRTRGDAIQDRPLAEVGGKGLFVKEIEDALLAGRVDLAVHSAKDVPAELPAGLTLLACPPREDPRDVLVARDGLALEELPPGARVGTSSLRRQSLLRRARPDLVVVPLRGNVDTRLRKVAAGELDAVVLAAAGLARLGLLGRVTQYLEPRTFIPAVAQGILALEGRAADGGTARLALGVHDGETALALTAERAFLERVAGGCQVPMGAHCRREGERLVLDAFLASPDGGRFAATRRSLPAAAGGGSAGGGAVAPAEGGVGPADGPAVWEAAAALGREAAEELLAELGVGTAADLVPGGFQGGWRVR